MKFPKNRGNLFLVIREVDEVCVGGFSDYEAADDFRAACEQEWLEKVPSDPQPFILRLTTYYG